jgi:hypothetical protein
VARGACLFLAKGQCVANGLPGKPAAPPPRPPVATPDAGARAFLLMARGQRGGGGVFIFNDGRSKVAPPGAFACSVVNSIRSYDQRLW